MVEERKVPEGYKLTEVGVIPEEWELEYIENLCVKNGLVRGPFGGALKKEYFVKYGYKVYEQKNAIYQNASIGSYYIDERKYNELKRFEVNPGDFIISCSGTIGKIYQIPESAEKGVINQALLKLNIDKTKIYDKFFYYYFDWEVFGERILDNTQGGAMKNLVGIPIFRKLSIPLPPFPEQQAIAEALSDVDNLITSLEKLIDKKQKIKQGAMQELLTGRKRLPGFTGEWNDKKLGDIAEITMGQSPDSKFYNSQNIGIPLVQGKADIDNRKTVIRYYTSQITKRALKDDIIMTVRAPVGYIGKASFDCCIGRGVCSIRYNNDFLYHYLIYIESGWIKLSKGSTFDSVDSTEVKEIELKIPQNKEEQQAIAQILSDMDAEIEALERKLEKYEAIKQGMMQELLTGRIRLV